MAFPPGRTLIVSPTYWHSLGTTPAVTVGSLADAAEFPLANLTDGLIGPVCKFATTAAGVNIPVTDPVNVLGILNHNFDPHVLIEAYVDGAVLPRTFSVRYPNCWIDLRAFAVGFAETGVDPSSSVGFKVYGNSRPVCISEVVVGQAYGFSGKIEVPFPKTAASPTQRHGTEYGRALLEWGSGVLARTMRLSLQQITDDDYELLQEVVEATAMPGQLPALQVPVVPNSRENDIWLVHWPARMPAVNNFGLRSIQLDLYEEPGGVVA